jgi:hypothetical protein
VGFSTKVTGFVPPVVASVVVKAADPEVLTVPEVGVVCTIVAAPAGPSTSPTNANDAVRHDTAAKATRRVQRFRMVRSPVQNASAMPGLWTHLDTRFWSNLEAK